MDFFDLRTAYLLMGMHYFTMPAAIWLALRRHRSPSVSAWCSGGVLFGMGLLLLSRRTQWPEWLTYDLANLVISAGQLACVQALRLELGQAISRKALVLVLLTFFASYELAGLLDPSRKQQYLVSLAFLCASFLWFARLAWRLAREQGLQSGYWLCAVCLPVVLVGVPHWLNVAQGLVPHGSLQINAGNMGIALMGNLVAMIGSTSFLGLYVERAQRQSQTSPPYPSPVRPNAQLARQIAQLERERGMGMVARSVVHELSQPLTSLQLIAEHAELDAEQRPQDSATLRAHIGQILLQARQTAQVLSRVRAFIAPQGVQRQRLDLSSLNTQVLDLLQDRLGGENITLDVALPTAPAWVMGHEAQLGVLLVNLYRQAIEASANSIERRIVVSISTQDARVQLRVHDSGPGLRPEALKLANQARGIFGPQAADIQGIGLLMGRKIAAEHQGQLRLSKDPAGGTVAELDLPQA